MGSRAAMAIGALGPYTEGRLLCRAGDGLIEWQAPISWFGSTVSSMREVDVVGMVQAPPQARGGKYLVPLTGGDTPSRSPTCKPVL